MKKKFIILSLVSLILAILIFIFTFNLYHYLGSDGFFSNVFHEEPVKPFVTLLFGILGTCFLFASITELLIAFIFCSGKKGRL